MGQDVLPADFVVQDIEAVVWLLLRFRIELPLKLPDSNWCFQTHRQSPVLRLFGCMSEVRVLGSAGITRFHRYYDPLRGPGQPPPVRRRSVLIPLAPGFLS